MMNRNKIKRILMRFMVWNMRWMTRYVGFIARPLVRLYANWEIIACGLSDKEGKIYIIYTPFRNVKNYDVHVFRGEWLLKQTVPAPNFSGTVVFSRLIPNATLGEQYRIHGQNNGGRKLLSPTITNKQNTIHTDNLLTITPLSDNRVRINWKKGEKYDPMIYFLVIEDDNGNTLSAIYTREYFWNYPSTKEASLSIGRNDPPHLQKHKQYTIKLVIVDFDGWVGCVSKKVFTY